jgi:hypothetical protein
VAVLAGTDQSKGVFIIDTDHGETVRSFGVTREAQAIGTVGPDGPLLVGIAGHTPDGRPSGAIERWSLEGNKTLVVPMPAQVFGLSAVAAGEFVALVGDDRNRAAVPVTVPALSPGATIPLDGGTDTVALCQVGSDTLLVFSGKTNVVSVRSMDSDQVVHGSVVAAGAACIPGQPRVYAISQTFLSRSILVFSVPNMDQIATVPASNDAQVLYASEDGGLLALDAAGQVSNIQYFSPDDFRASATAPPH